MVKEIWKDIQGYEGLYKVSNFGKVKRLKSKITIKRGCKTYKALIKGKVLSFRDSQGYNTVCLYKNGKGKNVKVHRIVAETFIKNNLNKPCVDHIDTNRKNNFVGNLRWVTTKENANNEKTIKKITKIYINGESIRDISERTGKRVDVLLKRYLQGRDIENPKSKSIKYEYKGKTLRSWCIENGYKYSTVKRRIYKGMDIESAIYKI